MKIIYTSHLEFRLKVRNIHYDLPRKVFKQAKEHYYDNLTKHYIAIHQFEFGGKIRDVALTYDIKNDLVEIITIHPIKPYQKLSRINSGRWKKYEQ
ncbi:MAG: hypothetical protein KKC39_04005 [Candidatus Omnitrophica bacterium]|nr:hypothetical protein [Candidatus Omnitrophota bacterium]MBU4467889.1 hypothetical protein [Candidatus Omnitrophota bacterium]MCG2708156.1 hypothetical protein [Candidatus Omnitrophota bacterium]